MSQFENAVENADGNAEEVGNQGVTQQFQHDYSFNLTSIVPPQPPKWKQVDHLYEDFKKFKRSCTRVFEDQWSMYKRKLRLIYYFCGADQMVKTYMKDSISQYTNNMTWNSFGHCLIDIVNQYVTFVLQDGNLEQ